MNFSFLQLMACDTKLFTFVVMKIVDDLLARNSPATTPWDRSIGLVVPPQREACSPHFSTFCAPPVIFSSIALWSVFVRIFWSTWILVQNRPKCCAPILLYELLYGREVPSPGGAAHIDVAWDIVDHYRHAILLSEGRGRRLDGMALKCHQPPLTGKSKNDVDLFISNGTLCMTLYVTQAERFAMKEKEGLGCLILSEKDQFV